MIVNGIRQYIFKMIEFMKTRSRFFLVCRFIMARCTKNDIGNEYHYCFVVVILSQKENVF